VLHVLGFFVRFPGRLSVPLPSVKKLVRYRNSSKSSTTVAPRISVTYQHLFHFLHLYRSKEICSFSLHVVLTKPNIIGIIQILLAFYLLLPFKFNEKVLCSVKMFLELFGFLYDTLHSISSESIVLLFCIVCC
jgi:hypothetical protein